MAPSSKKPRRSKRIIQKLKKSSKPSKSIKPSKSSVRKAPSNQTTSRPPTAHVITHTVSVLPLKNQSCSELPTSPKTTKYVSIILSSPGSTANTASTSQVIVGEKSVIASPSPPVIIPVAPIVAEKIASKPEPLPKVEKTDILTTISSKISAPLVSPSSGTPLPIPGRPVTRTATGARTTKVTKPKVPKTLEQKKANQTKTKNPVGRPKKIVFMSSVEPVASEVMVSVIQPPQKAGSSVAPAPRTPVKSPLLHPQKFELVNEDGQYLGKLKSPNRQGGLSIVRMETVSGEAAKTLTFAMAAAGHDVSGPSTSGLTSNAYKGMPKIVPGTSLTVRKVPPKVSKSASESALETPAPATVVSLTSIQSSSAVEPPVDVKAVSAVPVSVVTEEPKLPLETSAPEMNPGQCCLDELIVRSEPVLVDLTIDEIVKGNPLRAVDSDSTLTASETEAIEAQLQRKKVKSESSTGNRGSTPRRDKRHVENSPSSGNLENPPNSEGLRSPNGQPKLKRKESSARKSAQKKNLDQIGDVRDGRDPFCRDLNKHILFATGSSRSQGASNDSREPLSASESFRRNLEANDFRMLLASIKAEPKQDPPIPRLPYSYIQKDTFHDVDYRSSSEYANWLATRQQLAVEVSMGLDADMTENEKYRHRVRSMSMASEYMQDSTQGTPSASASSSHVIPAMGDDMDVKPKNLSRKKGGLKEGKKIGAEPLTDLGRWKPQDDMLLIMAVSEYRELALVHKHVKFSCHFTLHEVQDRWFNLLYNRKVSKSACQAMRCCPPDIMGIIQRKTPFSEAEEALLAEIPVLKERPTLEIFSMLIESNHHVFPSFRTAEDLEKHWRVMLADGRLENSDTLCTIPDDQLNYNNERILPFCEMEARIKDVELKDWKHVSGEFASEMERIQRQNRFNIMRLDKEMEHLRYLLEKSLNHELPDFTRPEFSSAQDRPFLAILLGQRAKFGIKLGKASFGRSAPGQAVDLDFSWENYAGKLSRLQGYIVLERNGNFRIENHGRRPVFVDEHILHHGDFTVLADEATIEVGDIRLQFYVNQSRVQRFLRQKYYGEWFSDDEIEDFEKEKKSSKVAKKSTKLRKAPESLNTQELIPAASPLNISTSPKKSRPKGKPVSESVTLEQSAHQNGGSPSRFISQTKENSSLNKEPDVAPAKSEAESGVDQRSPKFSGVGLAAPSFPSGVIVTPSLNRIASPAPGTISRSASAGDPRALISPAPRNMRMSLSQTATRPAMTSSSLTRVYMAPQHSMSPPGKFVPNAGFPRPFRMTSGQQVVSLPASMVPLVDPSKVLNGRPNGDGHSAPALDPMSLFAAVSNPDLSTDPRKTLG